MMVTANRSWRAAAGFTIIELLIAVAIIGVLASAAIPAFIRYIRKSYTVEMYESIEKIASGVKVYYNDAAGETPWDVFIDERKRSYGAPGSTSETSSGSVRERWAVWENEKVFLKLVYHFGKYDLTVYDKAVMAELEAKAEDSKAPAKSE